GRSADQLAVNRALALSPVGVRRWCVLPRRRQVFGSLAGTHGFVSALSVHMARTWTYAEVVAVIERHVDEAHRRVLRCTTDPARGLPRFKKRAEQSEDERVLDILLALLAEVSVDALKPDRLRADSFERIDGASLAAEDKRLRRRLQGIPETAP